MHQMSSVFKGSCCWRAEPPAGVLHSLLLLYPPLGFRRKEFRGKLAIAITANFINRNTTAEAKVEEISGVAFIFNQKFFQDLREATGWIAVDGFAVRTLCSYSFVTQITSLINMCTSCAGNSGIAVSEIRLLQLLHTGVQSRCEPFRCVLVFFCRSWRADLPEGFQEI